MDTATQGKWDRTARIFDFMTGRGPERRWGPAKRRLFAHMQGRILFLALGTGLDIACFPPGQTITAIDISPEMLAKAAPRAGRAVDRATSSVSRPKTAISTGSSKAVRRTRSYCTDSRYM